MIRKMILAAAIGLLAASWWTGYGLQDAKDGFIGTIQGTSTHLAGDAGDDWGS